MEKMWRVGGKRSNKTLLYCYLKFRHFFGKHEESSLYKSEHKKGDDNNSNNDKNREKRLKRNEKIK